MANYEFNFARHFAESLQNGTRAKMQWKAQQTQDQFRTRELEQRGTELQMRKNESEFNMRMQEQRNIREQEDHQFQQEQRPFVLANLKYGAERNAFLQGTDENGFRRDDPLYAQRWTAKREDQLDPPVILGENYGKGLSGMKVRQSDAIKLFERIKERQLEEERFRSGVYFQERGTRLQEKQFEYNTNPETPANKLVSAQADSYGNDNRIITQDDANRFGYPSNLVGLTYKQANQGMATAGTVSEFKGLVKTNEQVANIARAKSDLKGIFNYGQVFGNDAKGGRSSYNDVLANLFDTSSEKTANTGWWNMIGGNGNYDDVAKSFAERTMRNANMLGASSMRDLIEELKRSGDTALVAQVSRMENFYNTIRAVANSTGLQGTKISRDLAKKLLQIMDGNGITPRPQDLR